MADKPLLAAGIQAGSGLLAQGLNQIFARRNTARQLDANKELAQYQWGMDQEAWNRQNKYNTPQAQMARFKKAGLNPHLIYGKGTAGQATQLPKYSNIRAEKTDTPNFQGVPALEMYQNIQMQKANIDSIEAQTKNTNADTALKFLESPILNLNRRQKEFDLGKDREFKPYQFDALKYSTEKTLAEKRILFQKWEQEKITTKRFEENTDRLNPSYRFIYEIMKDLGIFKGAEKVGTQIGTKFGNLNTKLNTGAMRLDQGVNSILENMFPQHGLYGKKKTYRPAQKTYTSKSGKKYGKK